MKLIQIYLEYQKGTDAYEELQDFVEESDETEEAGGTDTGENSSEADPWLQIDFDGLKNQNQDVVGWIQIPALDISYPVVQRTDNFYYLSHLFTGESNSNGSIFVDFHNKSDFADQNTIIYGHNMKNGSMFGTLDSYDDKSLYDQNPYFYVYVPDNILVYQIFSCYTGKTGSRAYTYAFSDGNDFRSFVETIRGYAGYDTEVEVAESDKIVTLSTCVNSRRDYRYLVHGKLIQKIRR
ncbi:MAG: class B sortase [Candidatus Pacebacteria bacterium]|nr:class B sortase [Candidatus Paceibacterota bacterium]